MTYRSHDDEPTRIFMSLAAPPPHTYCYLTWRRTTAIIIRPWRRPWLGWTDLIGVDHNCSYLSIHEPTDFKRLCYLLSLQWSHCAALHSSPLLKSPRSQWRSNNNCSLETRVRVVNWHIQQSQKLSVEQSAIAKAKVSNSADYRPIWQSDSTIVLTLVQREPNQNHKELP